MKSRCVVFFVDAVTITDSFCVVIFVPRSIQLNSPSVVNAEIAAHVKALWSDPAIKNTFDMRSSFQLTDTCAYLFERICAIGAPDYVPSYEDVLHVRARTTGIAETTFGMDGGARFRLMDVGGQKNERKKWINMFEKVTAVIFVVAMSEYDQFMFEDASTNRMQDALQLFADTCNLRWFEDTSIILFLNKNDIFQQKIKKIDLKCCFPDYTGGCNYERAYAWIRKKFIVCVWCFVGHPPLPSPPPPLPHRSV